MPIRFTWDRDKIIYYIVYIAKYDHLLYKKLFQGYISLNKTKDCKWYDYLIL